jgi:hypothetical protein
VETIRVASGKFDATRYVGRKAGSVTHYRPALDSDVVRVVEGDTTVLDVATDRPLVGYRDLSNDVPGDLLRAVMALRYQQTFRTNGLKTTSRVFGFQPRITIRRDFCCAAALATEAPAEHRVIAGWAEDAGQAAWKFDSERMQRQQQRLVESVKPCWALPGGFFTSGIVNLNNPLTYHHDGGNFDDCWSVMVVFARDIEGGLLNVPELGLAFKFGFAGLICFDGSRFLHGVTPIRVRSSLGYRYSVVWYALKGMSRCLTPTDELTRVRQVRAEREAKRARGGQ